MNSGTIALKAEATLYVEAEENLLEKIEKPSLDVANIFLNGRTMIVEWNDGTKTQSTASLEDFFDLNIGFSICLRKKVLGKKIYGKPLFMRMINTNLKVQDVDDEVEQSVSEWKERYRSYGKD